MKTALSLVLAAALAAPAAAVEWSALGARPLGMGGAGVASPQGPLSAYWNSATLGLPESPSGLQLPVAVHAGLTGSVIEGASDLKEIADNSSGKTSADVVAALNKLDAPGNGARVNAGGGLDLKFGRWAFFANGMGWMGAVPQADKTNTNPATLRTTNNSKLIVKGARVAEFGVGHGRELTFAPGLFVGGNLKVLQGQVGYADAFIVREDSEFGDLFKKLKSGAQTSTSFGLDAGLLWDAERTFEGVPLRPRLGLTGRNLNNPRFKQPASAASAGLGKFALNPQLRMGAAFSPFNWWHFAADLDLTRNLTPIDGLASRQAALGTEINVFNRSWINIPLRVGLQKNLAERGGGTMLAGGAGVNLLHLIVDVSGAVSTKRVTTQSVGKSEKFPTEASAALNVSLLFGGGRDKAKKAAPSEPKAAPGKSAPGEAVKPEAPALDPAEAERVKESMRKAQEELEKASQKPKQ